MPDEPILREKAREAVQAGKLPARRPDGTWRGPGVGATMQGPQRSVATRSLELLCPVCEEHIRRNDLRMKARGKPVHVRCWLQARPGSEIGTPRTEISTAGG
jgi:hypothetical protein